MCNDSWMIRFADGVVKVLPKVDYSDHHPILACTKGWGQAFGPRNFRFESAWLVDNSYSDLIRKTWDGEKDCSDNLNKLEGVLKGWSKDTFGKVKAKKKGITC